MDTADYAIVFGMGADLSTFSERAVTRYWLTVSELSAIYCDVDDEYFPETEKPPLKGVGGWLLLFCIAQVVLLPIHTFDRLVKTWERIGPHPFPVVREFAVIDTIIILLVIVYGMVVGILIWKGNRNGRALARQYLIIRVIVAVLICTLSLAWAYHSFSSVGGERMAAAVVPATALEIASCLLWWCYFTFSKRVWNTYCAPDDS